MTNFDLFRDIDSYQTFKLQQIDSDTVHRTGVTQTWVISGTGKVCYEIKSYANTTTIRCRGSLEDHIPAAIFTWGGNATVQRGPAGLEPLEALLSCDSRNGPQAKILRCGNATYNWRHDVTGPGECSYKILDRQDPSTTLARLRVVQRVSGASFCVEIVANIWPHSQMCNSIIAAIVVMCKQDDPWLAGAGSGLL